MAMGAGLETRRQRMFAAVRGCLGRWWLRGVLLGVAAVGLGIGPVGGADGIAIEPVAPIIRALLADGERGLLIGTFGCGLWYHDRRSIRRLDATASCPPILKISRMVIAGDQLGIGTAGYGVWCARRSAGEWCDWRRVDPPAASMAFLHALLPLPGGRWFCGSVETGVARIDGERWQRLGTADGLLGDWVNDAIAVASGVWVGSNRGLSLVDPAAWRVVRKQYPIDDWLGAGVNALIASGDRLLIGTNGEGVMWLAPDGTVHRYLATRDQIHAFAVWRGAIYAGGDVGVWRLGATMAEPIQGPWQHREGIKSLAVGPAGELLLGGQEGRVYRSVTDDRFEPWLAVKSENGETILEEEK